MSSASKIILGSSCFATIGIIGYVHYKQHSDRSKLHEGVVRDVERQQRRKTENIYALQQQIEITKELKKSTQMRLLRHHECTIVHHPSTACSRRLRQLDATMLESKYSSANEICS